MTFDVWRKDGTEIGDGLQAWQGTWSMYHWAGWWLSFSPFIGIFLARISKGRSIRQYLFATIVLPAILTMIWMSWAGGHAIALELNGSANGELINTAVGLKIFSLIQLMFEPVGVWLVSMLLILLLVTYLTTTIDSAIIVSTSVLSKGTPGKEKNKATLVVSLILALVMALLIYADGFSPIRSAMVVASAPISALIVTLCLSISIAIYRDPVLK